MKTGIEDVLDDIYPNTIEVIELDDEDCLLTMNNIATAQLACAEGEHEVEVLTALTDAFIANAESMGVSTGCLIAAICWDQVASRHFREEVLSALH